MKNLTTALRFKLVVEELYCNNLAKAALALGLDRSTVSRYVAGREPPLSVLMLLSRLKNVDIDWLTEGTELKIQYTKDHYTGEVSRPVIYDPCEGVPDHTTPKYRGEFRQVAPFHNVPDRYWLRLSTDVPGLKLIARDYVLMQAIVPCPLAKSDVGCLRVMNRDGDIVVAVATEGDVKSKVKLLAVAHLVERDLL